MQNPRPLLEILIPTYRRPESAVRAIRSVLQAGHCDVRVLCQSNGYEPSIANLEGELPALTYRHFEVNRGAVVNFREILRGSSGQFCMFMSDEDSINTSILPIFVKFLREKQPRYTMCSVNNADGSPYFSLVGIGLQELTAAQVALLFTIDPTYISGYCFCRDSVHEDDIDRCFEAHPANAYPHLLLRNSLLSLGGAAVFSEPIIIKGAEALTGGDSHAHVGIARGGLSKHQLNPQMYGVQARFRQFLYAYCQLTDFAFLRGSARAYIRAYVMLAWCRMIGSANKVTGENFEFASLAVAKAEAEAIGARPSATEALFLRLITLRPARAKGAIVHALWAGVKLVKLAILVKEFGPRRTINFIMRRR